MFKLCVLLTVLAAARAGVIDLGYDDHGLLGAPLLAHAPVAVAHAPVAVAHGASSYQNNNLIALHPTAVVTKVAAPVVAAPVYTKVAAPISYGLPLGLHLNH